MSISNVKCSPNGPYLIRGPFVLTDPTGGEIHIPEGKNVALCRCGKSENKPFCDGQHSKTGFVASEVAKQP
jgi:CDGSH-type Zn-finger protein